MLCRALTWLLQVIALSWDHWQSLGRESDGGWEQMKGKEDVLLLVKWQTCPFQLSACTGIYTHPKGVKSKRPISKIQTVVPKLLKRLHIQQQHIQQPSLLLLQQLTPSRWMNQATEVHLFILHRSWLPESVQGHSKGSGCLDNYDHVIISHQSKYCY